MGARSRAGMNGFAKWFGLGLTALLVLTGVVASYSRNASAIGYNVQCIREIKTDISNIEGQISAIRQSTSRIEGILLKHPLAQEPGVSAHFPR